METSPQYQTDADPSFQGFAPPVENWSKLPHELINALPLIETIGEMKVILYVLRHTWGYHDEEKRITLDEFCNGRKRRDRTRLDNGTGLSKPTIIDGIERAVKHGFLEVETDERDKGRVKKFYSLVSVGVKKLDTREQESLHRSEKETRERNLKEPSSDDDDFSDLFKKPDREPITTNLPTSAQDPLDLAAKTQKARAQEKQWTTPQADADPWADKPLQGFCVLAGRTTLTASQQKHWPRELAKWALDWHATPDETYAAIKAIPDSEFHWMTFKTPFAPTFQETMDAMIDRIRNHQPINVKGNGHRDNGTQADPDLAAQINAAIEAKNAHRRANATAG